MKKLIIGITFLPLILLGACDDFLTTQNPNELTADVFFSNPNEVQQAVFTLYPPVQGLVLGGGGTGGAFALVGRGVETRLTTGAFDIMQTFANFNDTPDDGVADPFWGEAYTIIFRANNILANIDGADFSGNEPLREELRAETHFFRGLAYFTIAFMYGDAPLVLKPAEDPEDFNPPKSTIDELFDQAIADLQLAKSGLPVVQENPARVTKAVAEGFLGKTYLYRAGYLDEPENYSLAAAEFKEVIDSGMFSLIDNYRENFTAENENNEESLYEVQMLDNSARGTPTQPRPFNSVPGIGFEIFLRPSDFLMQEMAKEKTIDGEFDPRFLETVYFNEGLPLFGVPFNQLGSGIQCVDGRGVGGDPEGNSSTTGGWWRKYLNVNLSCPPILTGNSPDNNERVLRYADILLMYAEALVKSGGSLSEASSAVQQVRDRANLANKTFSSADELMDEIEHQRLIELAYENVHYFDLIRWGKLGEALRDHGTPTQVANFDPVKHKFFPIPIQEVTNNENLEQNPAY